MQGMRSEKAFAVTNTGDIKMSGKFLARASALSLAFVLAACGGDDSSTPLAGGGNGGGGSNGGGDTGTPTTPGVEIGSIQLITSTPAIGSAGQDKANITALVRDSNGVLSPDVNVSFQASNNGSLNVTEPTTSASGQASAELSTLGDERNRTISVTASAGTVSNSVNVAVSGTVLNLTGPSAISNGASESYEARLLDSAGQGIDSALVQIDSQNNTVSAVSLNTDSSGRVQFSLTANNGGVDTLSVAAFEGESRVSSELQINVSADSFVFGDLGTREVEIGSTPKQISITWTQNGSAVAGKEINFSTTRGSLSSPAATTNAQGVATVEVSSTDVGIAEITATAESSEGSKIRASQSFEFVSSKPHSLNVRATKTQISTNDETSIITTVRDINGNLVKNATVAFNVTDATGGQVSPGTVTTDSQGRAITTYRSTSSISEKDGVLVTATITRSDASTASESISLTVAGQALTLLLGTGNTIAAPTETVYDMPWSVLVSDANGNPSTNQSVQLSVLPLEFSKGTYSYVDGEWDDSTTETCQTNHADEVNGTEIANPASAPTAVVTDDSGSVEFNIRYTKDQCTWVKVRLTATSNVEGFSSSNSREFTLPCLAEDLANESVSPPGSPSPYNTQVCN